MIHRKSLWLVVVLVVAAAGGISVLTSDAQTPASSSAPTSLTLTGVGLNVSDLARSEAFYTEVFGLQRSMRFPAEGKLLEVGLKNPGQVGGMSIILAHFNDDPLSEGKSQYGRLVITTSEAEVIAKRAADAGSTLRNLGTPGGPVIIFLDDPDGYQIELYQAASGGQ